MKMAVNVPDTVPIYNKLQLTRSFFISRWSRRVYVDCDVRFNVFGENVAFMYLRGEIEVLYH